MGDLKYISAGFELKAEPDESGVFEGYASVFGIVDRGNDVVLQGAFEKTLARRGKIRMLWQHNPNEVIGVWEDVREDSKGLFVRGRLLDGVQRGRESLELMRAGAIDSLSIGYKTVSAEYDDKRGVRNLSEIDLFEISVVTFPMLPDATVTDVKSINTIRDYERFLRDAGLTKKQAVAAAKHGFSGISKLREAVDDPNNCAISGVVNTLEKLKEAING